MKQRMTKGMVARLTAYASEHVDPAKERRALDAAYAKAAPLVRKIVEAKYKPADMLICKKYDATYYDRCIRVQYPSGTVQEFKLTGDDGILVVGDGGYSCRNRIFLADQRAADAVDAWVAAFEAHRAECKKRVAAYQALAAGSRFMEEVVAVWPEVGGLFPSTNQALIALGPEQLAIIKGDVKERVKAAEKAA